VERGKCPVFGWRDAPTGGNRRVIGAVVDAFDNSESAVLEEGGREKRGTWRFIGYNPSTSNPLRSAIFCMIGWGM
jgi:hypothetical protein